MADFSLLKECVEMQPTQTHRDVDKRVLHLLSQMGLAFIFVSSNIAQRITFKHLGYGLGPYPYFVLISISATFPPIFGAACIGIGRVSSGFSLEISTWRTWAVLCGMGSCNALQGVGMVFANPHVAGYLQALLQQSMVPFTLAASLLILQTRFSLVQYIGVVLIISGVVLQILPSVSNGSGGGGSFIWQLVFVVAQLPVALAATMQEHFFQLTKVNVFLMMFWASTAQFFTIVLLAPVDCIPGIGDATSFRDFLTKMGQAWNLVCAGSVGSAFFGCIAALLLSQLLQVIMVNYSSAAFTMLCMAFVVPGSAIVFTLPPVMGANAERLSETAPIALALVFGGIICFKLGELKGSTSSRTLMSNNQSMATGDMTETGLMHSELASTGPISGRKTEGLV